MKKIPLLFQQNFNSNTHLMTKTYLFNISLTTKSMPEEHIYFNIRLTMMNTGIKHHLKLSL